MSMFSTKIPVNVQALLDQLPKGAFIHRIESGILFDTIEQKLIGTNDLVVVWSHEPYHTPLSVPTDFPAEVLKSGKLPKGVSKSDGKKTPPKHQNSPNQATAPEKAIPVSVPDYQWNAERLASELAKGPVEFQGVEAVWREVLPGHKHEQGFYYRKISVAQPVGTV